MTPKVAAKAFWIGESESELRRLKKEDFRFHLDEDLDKAMVMIDEERRQNIYEHPNCSEECKLRGTLIVDKLRIIFVCKLQRACTICSMHRMWTIVGYRWNMELVVPSLYVSDEGKVDPFRITSCY